MEVTVVPDHRRLTGRRLRRPARVVGRGAGLLGGVRQLALRDAAWLKPGEDLAVRARIPGAVGKLDARRVVLRKKLAAAKTRRGQARFARRLSRAYAAAAATLAPVTPAKGAPARLVGALRAASASQALSVAAANGQPKRYRSEARGQAPDAAERRVAALARAGTGAAAGCGAGGRRLAGRSGGSSRWARSRRTVGDASRPPPEQPPPHALPLRRRSRRNLTSACNSSERAGPPAPAPR